MEKYGCNREEEIDSRIRELSCIQCKTASENDELLDLKEAKKEIAKQWATFGHIAKGEVSEF